VSFFTRLFHKKPVHIRDTNFGVDIVVVILVACTF